MYNQVVHFAAGATSALTPAYLIAVTNARTYPTDKGGKSVCHTHRPAVQATVARIAPGAGRCWSLLPPGPHHRPDAISWSVMPGRLHQESTSMGVTGLGDRSLYP